MSEPIDTAYFDGPSSSGVRPIDIHKPLCNILYIWNRGARVSYTYPPGKNHPSYDRTAVPQLPNSFYIPVYPQTKAP